MLQVAMPLLFQGHIDLLEEYLSRSREQQAAFVQLLDQLIDSETNIDVVIRCLYAITVFIRIVFVVVIKTILQFTNF